MTWMDCLEKLLRMFQSAPMLRRSLLFVLLFGCAPTLLVTESRIGARHLALAPNCPLEFVTVSPEDMMPGARFGGGNHGYTMIGSVRVGAPKGTDPMSEPVREEVRARACAMGGEIIALAAAADTSGFRYLRDQTNIAFTVWVRHAPKSSQPTKF